MLGSTPLRDNPIGLIKTDDWGEETPLPSPAPPIGLIDPSRLIKKPPGERNHRSRLSDFRRTRIPSPSQGIEKYCLIFGAPGRILTFDLLVRIDFHKILLDSIWVNIICDDPILYTGDSPCIFA